MPARLSFRSLPPTMLLAALLVSRTVFAAPALVALPWPDDGAPVCTANGDQHAIFHSEVGCNAIRFTYLHSVSGTDSLESVFIGPIPPTGTCSASGGRIEAAGASELSGVSIVGDEILIGSPGCFLPSTASSWLQGSGSASQLIAYTAAWTPAHPRIVADEGDVVRHHPRVSAVGISFPDTSIVVAWSDERTGVPQIRAQRVTRSGLKLWGPSGLLIAPTASAETDPEITRLNDGSLLVVWLDARSGGSDVCALHVLGDGSAAPGWPATGLALESRPETASGLRLVHATFADHAFAVWEESGARFGGGRSIVARRLLSDGTPDPAWDPLGAVLSSSATVDKLQDAEPALGALVAVWTDTRAASGANPTDLFAQWITDSGAPSGGWPASGLAICTASGRQDAARVSATSSYAAFAWEDHRGADADIFAELRFADGTMPGGLWVPNGLPATSASGDQTAPVVGVGNSGGCYVAWQDARDLATTGLDIYAQIFNGDGDKLDVPSSGTPSALLLGPPRPNPMHSSAVFTLQLPHEDFARVEVLDLAGRRVRTLAAGAMPAGARQLSFDGRDDAGRELPPGLYRVRARIGDQTSSRTLIRIR